MSSPELAIATGIDQAAARRLLNLAVAWCDAASLVVREGTDLGGPGRQVLDRLHDATVETQRVHRWPGTELLGGGAATLHRFRLDARSAAVLAEVPIPGWLHPDYPEDLCLYTPDGRPWLVSITHERDMFIQPTPEQTARLLAEPLLAGVLSRRG